MLILKCQFESQEAFTRAFKALFNVTPAQYRKHNDPFRLLYKDQFSPNMLNFLKNEISMEPEIFKQPSMKLVGVSARYDNADLSLPLSWSAFAPFRNSVPNRVGDDSFGIYESYEEQGDEVKFSYVCSVRVSSFNDVPKGMTTREIP